MNSQAYNIHSKIDIIMMIYNGKKRDKNNTFKTKK